MRPKKLLYIAGPYRAKNEYEVNRNIQQARWYAEEITKKYPKYFCVVPHLNTSYMGGLQSDQYFLDGTQLLLSKCDAIYMLPGWCNSVGSVQEYEYSQMMGIEDVTEKLEV